MGAGSQRVSDIQKGCLMSTAGYIAFLEAMGHKIREHAGVYWFNVHPGVYMSVPFHKLVSPAEIDVKKILIYDGIALRYPCALEHGRRSFRIVVNDPDYDLPSLSSKARNQTRRGLENCEVKPLAFGQLGDDGIRLNRETLSRQGRKIPENYETYWTRYFDAASKSDGGETWGSFVNGELAAYLIAFRMEGVAHILIVRSAQNHLSMYPNNALLFTYIKSVLGTSEIREVSIGLEPIQGDMASLDRFKAGMGFMQLTVGQRVEFNPLLVPLIKSPLGRMAHSIAKHRSARSENMAKLAGMFSWYEKQDKPHV